MECLKSFEMIFKMARFPKAEVEIAALAETMMMGLIRIFNG